MEAKEQTKKAYELFSSGDMETIFNDIIMMKSLDFSR